MAKHCILKIVAVAVVLAFAAEFAASADPSTANRLSKDGVAIAMSSLPPDAQGPVSAALGRDDSRYWLHSNANGLWGENPGQALALEFSNQGADLISGSSHWNLQTRSYGYGDTRYPVRAEAPRLSTNRVEYRHNDITEWYENGPHGLEQGFTLAHSPGKANGRPLTIELALSGDFNAALIPGGAVVELRQRQGKAVLRYTGLSARDATGRELRSWIELGQRRLLLRVDDEGALYPLVVDPWIQQAELTAPDGGMDDSVGAAVAVSGSTVVVGAPCHPYSTGQCGPGVVYVFVGTSGVWSKTAELSPSDGAANDRFGNSVAMYGSTIVVGALYHKVGSNSSQGAAYVFVNSGGTWSQTAELSSSDGEAADLFGSAVAVYGSKIVVGAPCHPNQGNAYCLGPGAGYVFGGSGSKWNQTAELVARGGVSGDEFGWSVAVNGTNAVLGAPGRNQGEGAAYIFAQSGSLWTQSAALTASDGAVSDWFGYSVSISGTTALSGSPRHTVGSNSEQGVAYVFVESGSSWSQSTELTSSTGTAADWIGRSVSISGTTAVVGSDMWTKGAVPGQAYVFLNSSGTWTQQATLTTSAATQYFGSAVAVGGATVAIGDPAATVGSIYNEGAAYVFVK